MSKDECTTLAIIALLSLGAWAMLSLACCGQSASADSGPRPITLAKICAGEAGLQTETPDCGAIHYVLTDRAARMGVGYETAARWYASRHFDRERTDRRRWVAWLRADARRPRYWPSAASWSVHRGAWRNLLELARAYIRGEREPECKAHLWGDRHGDRRRALAAGYEPVECEGAVNTFWRVPWARPVHRGSS